MNVDFFFKRFDFFMNFLFLLTRMNIKIDVGHIEKTGVSPLILSFLSLILHCVVLFNLGILILVKPVSKVNTSTKAHFGCHFIAFKALLEVNSLV